MHTTSVDHQVNPFLIVVGGQQELLVSVGLIIATGHRSLTVSRSKCKVQRLVLWACGVHTSLCELYRPSESALDWTTLY